MSLTVSRNVVLPSGKTVTTNSGSTTTLGGTITLRGVAWPTSSGTAGDSPRLSDASTLEWKALYTRALVSADYTVASGVDVVMVSSSSGCTITLPAVSSAGTRYITILDRGGTASASTPITIATNGSDTIVGESSFTLSDAYNSVRLVNDGVSGWFIG